MTVQDHYLDSFRQTKENWAGVVDYFTKDLQRTFEQPFNPFVTVDPNETIDQIFDFWGKALEVQRDVLKEFLHAAISASEKVREQAESVGSVARAQAESTAAAVRTRVETAGAAVREQAEVVNSALQKQADVAREHATKTYAELTKAELQEQLDARDLPKTGNVDELRDRLVGDDLK
jgi:polyhydroxyalkanoate synthesis regulator protein